MDMEEMPRTRAIHGFRMQATLFPSQPVHVIDDDTANVVYWPDRLPADRAVEWLAWLMGNLPWRSDRRVMYDREVDVPRLRTHFDLHASNVPEMVQRAHESVHEVAPAPYTSVGLNLYRSGGDSVAPHNDRLAELMPGQPISLLSLGGPRDMIISSKTKGRRAIHLSLESGSVLVMDYTSQLNYLHGIPKASNAHPRISLAFRVRPISARNR